MFLNAANKTHYLFCRSVTPAAFCGAFFPFIIISKIITALLSSLSKATLCVLSVFCVNEAAKKLNAKTGEEKVLFLLTKHSKDSKDLTTTKKIKTRKAKRTEKSRY